MAGAVLLSCRAEAWPEGAHACANQDRDSPSQGSQATNYPTGIAHNIMANLACLEMRGLANQELHLACHLFIADTVDHSDRVVCSLVPLLGSVPSALYAHRCLSSRPGRTLTVCFS